ncbi:uncharacterized protein LOC141878563 [Acropora palmata]|uniref:uncharacterized protein LOC141878563 n=1 Tax=Acropora palmata TaxID=6131 RepID=UPI003DA00C20
MFNHLGYPCSLVNGIIDKCDYPSSLDAKTKSDETLRVSIQFKDQVSASTVKKQMRDLSSKIGIDEQPNYSSEKLEQDLKLKEIKPPAPLISAFTFERLQGRKLCKDRPRFLSTALDLLSFLESQKYLVSLFSLSSLLNHHRSVFFNVRWIVEIVLIKEQQHRHPNAKYYIPGCNEGMHSRCNTLLQVEAILVLTHSLCQVVPPFSPSLSHL